MKEILLNVESKEIRYALLKDGLLSDLIIERKNERQITGNVYRGRVTNILHNIQSAFIDISEGENGFIHISDILENTEKFERMFDMDFGLDYDISEVSKESKREMNIDEVLKMDQSVLVQVVKEPLGSKGARLTSNISIPGRYLVLLPNSKHRGVSRKIEDRVVRDRLKRIIRSFEMPQDMGLICRTASRLASQDALIDEAHDLLKQWQEIVQKFNEAGKPALLYEESDIVKRALINAVDKKYDRILIDNYRIFQACRRRYQKYSKEHPLKIEFYRDKTPMFERFNVEKEVEKASRRKIWLNSGGYLYFERTEAMYTIDVNSGRSTNSEGDLEETLVRINIEAAEEIARQLRLRNVGGLVVCDFIDMRARKNKRRVLNHLRDCMKEDTAKCTILGMSDFGLVEMTRQRAKNSLHQTLFMPCPYCSGQGDIKTYETVSIEIERLLKKAIQVKEMFAIKVVTHPEIDHFLNHEDKSYLKKMAEKLNAKVEFDADDALHLNDFNFFSMLNQELIEV